MLSARCSQADRGTVLSFLNLILQGTGVKLANGHGLTDADTLANYAFDEENALEALRRLVGGSKKAQLPVVLRDNQLFVKQAVGAGDPVTRFSADTNLIKLDRSQKSGQDPDAPSPKANRPAKVKAVARLEATALGDPSLKVGLRAQVDGEEGDFRIESVRHLFSSGSGFTSLVQLADARAGDPFPVDGPPGAQGFTNAVLGAAAKARRPDIDVGEVKGYAAGAQGKHRATLNYGQSPRAGDAEPAVATPVDADVQLHNKPIASPFAWHNCGLVVPVYPGMRALIAHNRGDTNDAVVDGFLWSQIDPNKLPPNHAGDYWLCLPTQISGGLPSGPTANDLTTGVDPDNPDVPPGLRVVQAAGLHIQVGDALLATLGTRPTPASKLHNRVIIEHKSGTTITIKPDGAVEIKTGGQKISLTNGQVSLTLDGSSVGVN